MGAAVLRNSHEKGSSLLLYTENKKKFDGGQNQKIHRTQQGVNAPCSIQIKKTLGNYRTKDILEE
jgi:hypothetical protein